MIDAILALIEETKSKLDFPEEWALNEGLILTHDSLKTKNTLKKSEVDVYQEFDDKITIRFNSNKFKTYKKQLGLVDSMGWFPASIQPFPSKPDVRPLPYNVQNLEEIMFDHEQFLVTFEPKFEMEVEIPRHLYHLTPRKNLDRIMKQGLAPREDSSKRSHHPPRIYFTKTEQDAINLADKMTPEDMADRSNKAQDRGIGALLKILAYNLPVYFKLHSDPNYKDRGYFSVNGVPPSLVRVVGEVELSGKQRN